MPVRSFSSSSLRFAVADRGPATGPVAVLLHGFPEDETCWDDVAAELAAGGIRTLAPQLRGDGPAARPEGTAAYRPEQLVDDVMALLDAAGVVRAHLVGHDLGALVAWWAAATRPARVACVVGCSVPHPAAMAAARFVPDQARRSWYAAAFQVPGVEHLVAATAPRVLGRELRDGGVDAATAARLAGALADPATARARISWYRALARSGMGRVPPVTVPSALLWGRSDPYIGPAAVRRHSAHVSPAGRVIELPAGHWLPECHAAELAAAVLATAAGADRTLP